MILPAVVIFAMCGACVARPVVTPMCTPCLSVRIECDLFAMTQNGPRLCGNNLLWSTVAVLSAMTDVALHEEGLSKMTRLPREDVGVSQR